MAHNCCTVNGEHYGHWAKIIGYGYSSTGSISHGLLSLGPTKRFYSNDSPYVSLETILHIMNFFVLI